MSQLTRTYTFSDGSVAYGSQVESEIANIVNTLNSLDLGSLSWTAIKTSGSITITGSGSGLILTSPDGLHTYLIAMDNDGSLVTGQIS